MKQLYIAIIVVILLLISAILFNRLTDINDIKNSQAQLLEITQQIEAQKIADTLEESQSATTLSDSENQTKKADSNEAVDSTYVYAANPNKSFIDLNNDYMGWLKIAGTQVDYPFVRGQDNQFYLDHDFNKKSNELGAIFMDYRNLGNFIDDHTVIYGHYVKSGKMFGELNKYLDKDFLKANPFIEVQGLYETKTYAIISVYEEVADAIELNIHKVDDAYIDELIRLSSYPIEVKQRNGKLLTLATCTYALEEGRLIIHALEITE